MSGVTFCGGRLQPVREADDSPTQANSARVYSTTAAPRATRAVAPRVQSRRSVATWSLRDRPVCSLPATVPTSAYSNRSTRVCTSSSGAPTAAPSASRSATRSRPSSSWCSSLGVSTPTRPSAWTQALLAATSWGQSRWSTGRLRFSASSASLGPRLKRPPHIWWAVAGAAGDGGVERLPLRRPPAAVVHQVGVAERQLVLEPQGAPVEHHLLELAVRRMQQRAARRLVDTARFHADQPVLHDVRPADAVLARRGIQGLEQLHRAHRHVVHADGRPLLEADLDDHREVGGFERIFGQDEDVLRRLARGIFEDATLVRAVPEIAVSGVRLLDSGLDRHALGFHVGDEIR